jgi:RNA polymerase sigma factor (sigma-70 family)
LATAMGGTARELLKTLFDTGTVAGLSDAELLDRFEMHRDSGAQAAFAALVERHGPMVLRVCRDTLGNAADAEDAFQATFVVLARRAGAIRCRESVGPWIYGVALRVAACSRKDRARRRDRERRVAGMVARNEPDAAQLDVAPAVHEEVGRLPDKYRAAVVLCYLEGLTHEQAASQLGWPVGTVRSRLAWAREKLRSRLVRRGLAPSAALISANAEGGAVVVPASLVEATVRSAMAATTAGAVPAAVAILTGHFLRRSIMVKLGWMATALVATGLVVAGGVGLLAAVEPRGGPQQAGQEQPSATSRAQADSNAPAAVDPEQPNQVAERARPLRDSAAEPPRVLAAKLLKARRSLAYVESLAKKNAVSSSEVEMYRVEVEIVTAQLEAVRDELQDELELLEAQLQIRKAELRVSQIEPLGGEAIAEGRLSHDVRKAQVTIKEAEIAETQVRINQVKRRLEGVSLTLKSASLPLSPSAPTPGAAPVPPAGK